MDTQLRLRIEEPGSGPERVEEQCLLLRQELLRLDVDDVDVPTAGSAPSGARAIELVDVGTLVVALRGSVELARQIIHVLRGWLRADPSHDRSVELVLGSDRIVLSGASPELQERLVEEFVAAIGGR
jgi:hypothetical protein